MKTKEQEQDEKLHAELMENLDEWASHFRENQHGATLTVLRARKVISELKAKVAWLEDELEGAKRLAHDVGAGRVDSRLLREADLMRDAMRLRPSFNAALESYENFRRGR